MAEPTTTSVVEKPRYQRWSDVAAQKARAAYAGAQQVVDEAEQAVSETVAELRATAEDELAQAQAALGDQARRAIEWATTPSTLIEAPAQPVAEVATACNASGTYKADETVAIDCHLPDGVEKAYVGEPATIMADIISPYEGSPSPDEVTVEWLGDFDPSNGAEWVEGFDAQGEATPRAITLTFDMVDYNVLLYARAMVDGVNAGSSTYFDCSYSVNPAEDTDTTAAGTIVCQSECGDYFMGDSGKATGFIGDFIDFGLMQTDATAGYTVEWSCTYQDGTDLPEETSYGDGDGVFYFADQGAYTVTATVYDGSTLVGTSELPVEISSSRVASISSSTGNNYHLGDRATFNLLVSPETTGDNLYLPQTCDWSFDGAQIETESCDSVSVYFNQEISGIPLEVVVTDERGTVIASTTDNSSQFTPYVSAREANLVLDSSSSYEVGQTRTFTASVDPDLAGLTYRWYINGVEQTATTSKVLTLGETLTLAFDDTDENVSYSVRYEAVDADGLVVGNEGYNNSLSFTVAPAGGAYDCHMYTPVTAAAMTGNSLTEDGDTFMIELSATWQHVAVVLIDCNGDAVEPADCSIDATGTTCIYISIDSAVAAAVYDSTTAGYEYYATYTVADKTLHVYGVPLYTLAGGTGSLQVQISNPGYPSVKKTVDISTPYVTPLEMSTVPNYLEACDSGEDLEDCTYTAILGPDAVVGAVRYDISEDICGNSYRGTDNYTDFSMCSTGHGTLTGSVTGYNGTTATASMTILYE